MYPSSLADRIRKHLAHVPKVKEKEMMGGLAFMVNDKMCVGIFRGELMCRLDKSRHDEYVERNGCQAMSLGGKVMRGWVLIEESATAGKGMKTWIDEALDHNKVVKKSKK
jgi:TfoX/Sxy family transcriptional regulator of competence genes